jgi:hypothetical protein
VDAFHLNCDRSQSRRKTSNGRCAYLPIVNGRVFELLVYIESPENDALTLTTDCFWVNLVLNDCSIGSRW